MLAGDDYQRARRRDRLRVVSLANRILLYYGLHMDDWNGSKYILSDRKGSPVLVQDIGSLWTAVEQLAHRSPDPLDPSLLETLQSLPRNTP